MKNDYDVIIIGGSYSGLAAAMALGRALRRVLVVDGGSPCNAQAPFSHNFLTQDGKSPREIGQLARQQVNKYDTVEFLNDLAIQAIETENSFEIHTKSGKIQSAQKLIFATGIEDTLPDITGFTECWGISILHCPYCHGYEARGLRTGILGNGVKGFELAKLISNWNEEITILTNGKADFMADQLNSLGHYSIKIDEREILEIEQTKGSIDQIVFTDHSKTPFQVLYTRLPFLQQCALPEQLGCAFTEEGYIKTDRLQKTSVSGVFACGDNCNRMRTIAHAVASGTTAGMIANRELIDDHFNKIKP
ncbi:MAG: NAD(P)/FAD-dependent oxidoreductase [Saprospiraceae bacterium]|nr:NAD(P)/FAD-dependent oxidoreductase [Saprospiraceae bacterium]